MEIDEELELLVLASDGLWDVVANEVSLVNRLLDVVSFLIKLQVVIFIFLSSFNDSNGHIF